MRENTVNKTAPSTALTSEASHQDDDQIQQPNEAQSNKWSRVEGDAYTYSNLFMNTSCLQVAQTCKDIRVVAPRVLQVVLEAAYRVVSCFLIFPHSLRHIRSIRLC